MNRTTITLIIVVIVLVIGGILLLNNYTSPSPSPSLSGDNQGTPSPSSTPDTNTTPSPSATSSPLSSPASGSSPSPSSMTATPSPTPSAAIKAFTITGRSFSFSPSTIAVKKGDRVRITFKSVGGAHDLVTDAFSVRTDILNSGEEDSIEFVADKTGSFPYYCSVGTHRAMGMEGTIVVE